MLYYMAMGRFNTIIVENNIIISPFFIIDNFMESTGVEFPVVDHIDTRLIDGLHIPHAWVNAEGRGTVYTGHGHTVSRLYLVHQVTVGEYNNSMWRLSGRHVLWKQKI